MSEDSYKVTRIEGGGQTVSTEEMPEVLAAKLYDNWANSVQRYNDRSVSLVRVSITETVVSTHINTAFVDSSEKRKRDN